jgi:hypothetical protein
MAWQIFEKSSNPMVRLRVYAISPYSERDVACFGDMFARSIQGMKPEDAVTWATGEMRKIYAA